MTTNARDEKWSEWRTNRGVQPNHKTVEVKFDDGSTDIDNSDMYFWPIDGDSCCDIIAYRYKIKEPESGIADPDEEECLQLAYERMGDESVKVSLDELREQKYSAYFKDVRHIDTLDVYRVLSLFDCEKHGHPIGHAAKKLLLSGSRTGGKDVESDVREAIDTLHRWLEMREEDRNAL